MAQRTQRTSDRHKVPVIPIEVGQSRYLISPYGESDWVRNLRAAGTGELSRKGQSQVFQAAEVPVDELRAIIARYREVAGNLVSPCFKKLPDDRKLAGVPGADSKRDRRVCSLERVKGTRPTAGSAPSSAAARRPARTSLL